MLRLYLTNLPRRFTALIASGMILALAPMAQATPKIALIDIDIDRNRDGISDQLLAATQQHLDIRGAAQKRFEAQLQRDPNFDMEAGIKAINALADKLSRELTARMPYTNRVKQLFAEENRIVVQLGKLQPSQKQEYKALEARKIQIYQEYSRDPSYVKIEQAQTKVYRVIDRRGSAQWLYGTSGRAIPD
jgi:hypothetical protein